ncbi:uncharacterized protein C13orf42 [Neosynchiropus ocellatus]
MFRKINNVFRPNHQRGREGGSRSEHDYHNACTVRLVRSTSMLVVGQRTQAAQGSTLKRSKSTVSVESTLYLYQRQEDRIWLYSQDQNCLEYLEELVALRQRYTRSVCDLKAKEGKAHPRPGSKKKPAPAPPKTEVPLCVPPKKPSAPPVPTEEDTLEFFDQVIASCDSEPHRKPYVDDGHADVDFIVATSSAEHDLHSNWMLRVPRVPEEVRRQKELEDSAKESVRNKKKAGGSASSRTRLQRNPIHLPKVVESAFQTLRFKPKLKKR